MATFWHPTRPFDLRVAVLRMAAATGTHIQAVRSEHLDFNGHRIEVDYSEFRKWGASYYWSGIHWLACRCSFEYALEAAEREHGKGALGSEVRVQCETPEHEEICIAHGLVPYPGFEARNARIAEFVGPLHARVNEAVRDQTTDLLLSCTTVEEYDLRRKSLR